MFYACIPLFSYMGTNLGQMPAAAALRLLRLRLRLEIPAADRGTGDGNNPFKKLGLIKIGRWAHNELINTW